jgi:hypothetical protein
MSEQEAEKAVKVETSEQKVEAKVEAVEKAAEVAADATKTTDAEDAKRMGVKEVVSNPDAMAIEKEKAVPAEKNVLPSFFIDKSSKHRIEIDILSSKEDGKIMSVSRTGLGLNFSEEFGYLRHTQAWFDFTLPTYEDMSSYRARCATFRREVGQLLVDKLQLRNYMLVWHLKDWSLQDKDGKIELNFDKDGSLDTGSVQKVYSLHPTIIDVMLTIFEKDILLT